mmetsp:Transcript_57354/g.101347  ORF Transcript_57354/g.101347 Transcript_57354/m.101347 type:complete len:91 (-) Transcript_57354:128-400(-)
MGHDCEPWEIALPQALQTQRWPHGTKACVGAALKQTTHSVLAGDSAVESRRDDCCAPPSTATPIGTSCGGTAVPMGVAPADVIAFLREST